MNGVISGGNTGRDNHKKLRLDCFVFVGNVKALLFAALNRPACRHVQLNVSANITVYEVGYLQSNPQLVGVDRKSTRLNSSHQIISYAVFCLKKKKRKERFSPQYIRMSIEQNS